MFDLVVIGGGAAGYFAAISAAELSHTPLKIIILESTKLSLQKVKVSGGGRCNITHHCYEPKKLIENYPRGAKELLGAFYKWGPKNQLEWFKKHGVDHHVEADGRIFPHTNRSSTIIQLFQELCKKFNIQIRHSQLVTQIKKEDEQFTVISEQEFFKGKQVLMATGSGKGGHNLAVNLGHTLSPVCPSIFTFKSKDKEFTELSGVSLPNVTVRLKVDKKKFLTTGPLLFTHWGYSGPAILKLSAFAAVSYTHLTLPTIYSV